MPIPKQQITINQKDSSSGHLPDILQDLTVLIDGCFEIASKRLQTTHLTSKYWELRTGGGSEKGTISLIYKGEKNDHSED